MSYDYTIFIYLEIEHKYGIAYYQLNKMYGHYPSLKSLDIERKYGISYHQLNRIHGFYPSLDEIGFYDSDEEECDRYYNTDEYRDLHDKILEFCLIPRKPLVIFENEKFKTPKLKKKFLPFLIDKINEKYIENYYLYEDTGKFTKINDIIKVTRKEIRVNFGEEPRLYFINNNNHSNNSSDNES